MQSTKKSHRLYKAILAPLFIVLLIATAFHIYERATSKLIYVNGALSHDELNQIQPEINAYLKEYPHGQVIIRNMKNS